jgi:hypothetical protein
MIFQAAASLQPMNHPTNQAPDLRSPAQQQAQQQVCGEKTTIG